MLPESSPESVVEDPATTQDIPAPASTGAGTDGTAAASSTTETKPAETLLDRVKALSNVDRKEASPPSEKPGTSAAADPASKAKSEDDAEWSPEEKKGLHAKTRERFERLTSKLTAKDTEIASLAPKAAEYDKIDTFIRNAGLSPQDVGSTLEMAALLRSDKAAAYARLLPLVEGLAREIGETLSPELQARVDQGYLTEEDAKAIARSTAAAELATGRLTETSERQRQATEAAETKQQIDSTTGAIEKWEAQKASTDPDWQSKRAEVAEQVELAIERKSRELKRPYWPTPEEARKLSEDALETVEKRFKRFTPKPKAIDPPVTAGASSRSVPAPKNTLDIVKRLSGGAA